MGGALGGVGGAAFGGAPSASPISPGAAVNGIGTNALVGGDVAKGLALNGSLLAGSPGFALAPEVMAAPTITSAANAVPSVANIPGFAANAPSLMSTAANAVPAVTETTTAAAKPSIFQQAKDFYNRQGTLGKIGIGLGGSMLLSELTTPSAVEDQGSEYNPLKRFKFDPRRFRPSFAGANGGIASLASGGETMASGGYDRMVGETPMYQEMASGGISSLGGYSDGGRLLRGPGDGVSDDIPAQIGQRRPARLADGEFVVPARIVSELGNGSTDAGARQLYAMMDRVQANRRKTMGKDRVAVNAKASKYLPA
jgi:hypothetical protein